jgi:hypothetical protein
MDRKLPRVAVVGCGVAATTSPAVITDIRRSSGQVLCDIDAAPLATTGDEFSVPWCSTSFDELMCREDIDIEPNEHAIDNQKLLASLCCDVVVINRWLGVNAERRQLFGDAVGANT